MSLEIRLVQVIGWNLEVLKILANLVNVTGLKNWKSSEGSVLEEQQDITEYKFCSWDVQVLLTGKVQNFSCKGKFFIALHCTTEQQSVRVKTNSQV
jgi:hypothetical protein